MEIELRGSETIVRLNGEAVNDFKQGSPVPERKMHYEPVRGPRPDFGYIGLQNHDAKSVVSSKKYPCGISRVGVSEISTRL